MNKRIIWNNFFKLMAILSLLVIFLLFFVYCSSLEAIQEQFCQFNEQKVELVESNLTSAVEQSQKLTAYLCTETDSKVFFKMEDPQIVDEDIYTRISARLESYDLGINYISSILLYSQEHNRLIDKNEMYYVKNAEIASAENIDTGWMVCLENEDVTKRSFMMIRTEKEHYPFVLTIVQRYLGVNIEGIAVANLDLKKLYDAIWPEKNEDTKIYVLDENGQIIIAQGKQKLYESREGVEELNYYQLTEESLSLFFMEGNTARTYAQQYNEKLKMYIVSVSTLKDYNDRIWNVQKQILIIFFGIMTIIGSILFFYCRTSFHPLQSIMDALDDPRLLNLKKDESAVNVKEVSEQIVFHLQNNRELRQELENHLELLKETQLQALQAQLNPHFLFNTLDAIGMMVETEEDKEIQASKLVQSLTDILRYSLSGKELVTLQQESFYMENYIYILRCRYADSFGVNIQMSKDVIHSLVPKLILQPLIENAVFHGIMAREDESGGQIKVTGSCIQYDFGKDQEAAVMLEISDNGNGISKERLEKLRVTIKDMKHVETEHIGVQNVAKRLYLLFAERSVMEIESAEGVGTVIRLIFPKLENMEEEVQYELF